MIDAKGGTILPGLIESHFHATYFNVAQLEDRTKFLAVMQGGIVKAGRLAPRRAIQAMV